MGLGLEQGDEVITADFTFAATVEVIALLKLTPVLVDVEPDTFNIDIEALKKQLLQKLKQLFLFIYLVNVLIWKLLWKLPKNIILFVIEDNAQAIGADYTFLTELKRKLEL